MNVVSVNVGLPREVKTASGVITTGILKSAVEGPVRLREHNLDGDAQANLKAHGGPAKAAYVYPLQYYRWREPDRRWHARC